MKMPSDDQANSVIPQTRFRVHGNTLFLSRKHAYGNGALHQALSHVVSTLHGRSSVLGLGIGIWVTPCYQYVQLKFANSTLPRLASYCLRDISALSSYALHRGEFSLNLSDVAMITQHIDH